MTNASAPLREIRLGPREVDVERRTDGSILIRRRDRLGAYPRAITERLEYWAERRPARIFMAQRRPDGEWQTLSYADFLAHARCIAQALLERKLAPARPVVSLSDNDLEQALLTFGALLAGVPFVPVSPNYSLLSTDYAKLAYIVGLVRPGLVFVNDAACYAGAIAAALPSDAELVLVRGEVDGRPATRFAELLASRATDAVDRAHAAVGPESIAKVLFTSGSTGIPKPVVMTQRHWCANQQAAAQALPGLADDPQLLCDWLPWHHCFGGTFNVGLMLYNGGSYYIDKGKPLPGMYDETLRNLRELPVTLFWNTPRSIETLVAHLRRDEDLRRAFFRRLRLVVYGGAVMPQHVWDALESTSIETCGERVLMTSCIGSTEVGPLQTVANWSPGRPNIIGLPVAGTELKLVRSGDKWEGRARGPSVTAGYFGNPEMTRESLDEEGFFRTGDAFKWVDRQDPGKGLEFDGRIGEDFKLSNGTWVSVGPLREALIAQFAPLIKDVVVAGPDRPFLAALLFPDADACRAHAGLGSDCAISDVMSSPLLRQELIDRLESFAIAQGGSSRRIVRAVVESEPATIDSGEVTDKGSVNQKNVLERRRASVGSLYASAADAGAATRILSLAAAERYIQVR